MCPSKGHTIAFCVFAYSQEVYAAMEKYHDNSNTARMPLSWVTEDGLQHLPSDSRQLRRRGRIMATASPSGCSGSMYIAAPNKLTSALSDTRCARTSLDSSMAEMTGTRSIFVRRLRSSRSSMAVPTCTPANRPSDAVLEGMEGAAVVDFVVGGADAGATGGDDGGGAGSAANFARLASCVAVP